MEKKSCPYCNKNLEIKISRKQTCTNCKMNIYVRSGKLVTEDQGITIDWLEKLENNFGIDQDYFENERKKLSNRFGTIANAHDTVWKILNGLVIKHYSDNSELKKIYHLMASLLSEEDRNPLPYLIEEARARNIDNYEFRKHSLETKKSLIEFGIPDDEYDLKSIEKELRDLRFEEFEEEKLIETKLLFLSHEELRYIRRLSKQSKFNKAEELLYRSQPTPAVLDEVRKICSKKANIAKNNGDWASVIKYLEEYRNYADNWREFCIKSVNQLPPEHTSRDNNLLKVALKNINKEK